MLIRKLSPFYLPFVKNDSLIGSCQFIFAPNLNNLVGDYFGNYPIVTNTNVSLNNDPSKVCTFNGTDSFLSFGDNIESVGNFSLFIIFKTGSDVTNKRVICSKRPIAGNLRGYEIYTFQNKVYFLVSQADGSPVQTNLASVFTISANNWYGCAFNYVKNQFLRIVGGVINSANFAQSQSSALTTNVDIVNSLNFTVGKSSNGGDFFDGKIALISFYNSFDNNPSFNISFFYDFLHRGFSSHLGF